MAGTEKLEVLITAKDEASKVLEGVAGAASGVFKVGMFAATAAAGALATGIGFAITQAMDFQNVFAQTEAVIKSTGGVAGITAQQVADLGASFSQVTKFGEEEVMMGENLLLTFTNIGADVFPQATQTMLDMSAALGQDLKSSAIQLGKALQDPVLGVTALRRVGVNFNDEQMKLIKNLVDTGKSGEAVNMILKELQTEFGGSAEAAGKTFSGQLTILKNGLSETAEAVGMGLMPILQSLMGVILPYLPVIQNLAQLFGDLINSILQYGIASDNAKFYLSAIFGPEIAAKILEIVNWFTTLYNTISNFVTTILVPFVLEHSEAFKGALTGIAIALAALGLIGMIMQLGVVIGALTSPIGIIIIAAGLLGAAWATNWGGIRDKLTAAWGVLQPILTQLWGWLQTNIPIAITWLTNTWQNVLLPALTRIWQFLSVDMMPIWKALGELFNVTIALAITALTGLWQNVLQPALQNIWSFIQDKVIPIFTGWSDSIGGISGAIQTVLGWIQDLIDAIKNIKLPDWLTPGSPTPFELGLRGIADAFKDVTRNTELMRMTLKPALVSATAPGYAVGQNLANTYYYNLNIQGSQYQEENIIDDFNMLKTLTRR